MNINDVIFLCYVLGTMLLVAFGMATGALY